MTERSGTDSHPGPAGRREPRAEIDPETAATLVRSADRTAKQVTALDRQVRQLGADVARIAALLADGHHRPGPCAPTATTGPAELVGQSGPGSVRSWLTATDLGQAVTDLAELIAWLGAVYLHYPDALLSACWLWHPHVVEELWWLAQAHGEAYHPETGTWLKVGDWHDRQRPLVARRVRDALAKCDLPLHADVHDRDVPLVGHASAIATAWTSSRIRPVPTSEQLDEAKTLNRQSIRPRR